MQRNYTLNNASTLLANHPRSSGSSALLFYKSNDFWSVNYGYYGYARLEPRWLVWNESFHALLGWGATFNIVLPERLKMFVPVMLRFYCRAGEPV